MENNNRKLIAVDSNVLVYAQTCQDIRKKIIAADLISRERPVIADRVAFEFLHVIRRLHKFHDVKHDGIFDFCLPFLEQCTIQPVTLETIKYARQLVIEHEEKKDPLQLFDAVILATSVEAGCTILYSEDMRDGLQEKQITVINPFKTN
jgi:predicted nucleic acid-binding protein